MLSAGWPDYPAMHPAAVRAAPTDGSMGVGRLPQADYARRTAARSSPDGGTRSWNTQRLPVDTSSCTYSLVSWIYFLKKIHSIGMKGHTITWPNPLFPLINLNVVFQINSVDLILSTQVKRHLVVNSKCCDRPIQFRTSDVHITCLPDLHTHVHLHT